MSDERVEADTEAFEKDFVRAGKIDSGEINPQSDWIKVSCGERAYYQQRSQGAALYSWEQVQLAQAQ